MRIGIMTHWWSDNNYGQILQCYALQHYLRSLGHDAYLIRYIQDRDIERTPIIIRIIKALNPLMLYNYFKRENEKRIKKKEKVEDVRENPRGFDEFRNNYLKVSNRIYYSLQQLQQDPPDADAYIVGSDQVWNFKGKKLANFRNRMHSWFLDFGSEDTKRISFAASWGQKYLAKDHILEIIPLIERFDFVSVREKSGLDLCEKCGSKDARWYPDPVLLLNAKNYRELYLSKGLKKKKEKQILLYWLNNGTNFSLSAVFKWASNKGYKVRYVTANNQFDDYPKEFPSIEEWLQLLDSSEFVITNSFHCSLFSLIFHVPFAVVPLDGRNIQLNERMESLFEIGGIENRYITEDTIDTILNRKIDFSEVDSRIIDRKEFSDFRVLLDQVSI